MCPVSQPIPEPSVADAVLNTAYLARFRQKPQSLRRLRDDFDAFCFQALQQLAQALDADDLEDYQQVLHSLRGTARAVGARRLESVCQWAEHRSAQEVKHAKPALLNAIRQAIQQAQAALTDYLESLTS
jgi:HPt (histidine-containing phosphotransfer) domain-containing protein